MRYVPRAGTRRLAFCGLKALLLGSALVASAVVAQAQGVAINPRTVSFTPSADHDAIGSDGVPVVTEYQLALFLVDGEQPIVVLNLGKPTPASDGNIHLNFVSLFAAPPMMDVALGARVFAVGPGGSGVSAPSNPFVFESAAAPRDFHVFEPAPVLRIIAPGYGAGLKIGQAVTLAAAVIGNAIGVDFYVNGVFVATAATSPFQVTWTGKATGKFTVTAVAVSDGVQVTSQPVLVIVNRVVPKPRPRPQTAVPAGVAKRR